MAKKRKKSALQSLSYDFENKSVKVAEKFSNIDNSLKWKKWIIYARVSTDEQKTKWWWIGAQITDCKKRAKKNWVEIVCEPFYDEAISWTKHDRPDFDRAFEFIKKANRNHPEVELFIVQSTSRFSRSHDLWWNYTKINELEAYWVKLATSDSWLVVNLEDEIWFIQYNFSSMNDAIESIRWQKRVRYWIQWKLMEWYRPFSWVPFWYKRVVTNIWWKEVKVLVRDEERAPILKKWLEDFADWIIYTKKQLHDYFEEHNIKSNSKTNKSWKLSHAFIDDLLQVRKLLFYAWYIINPDYDIREKIPWKHTPIIDELTMFKIQSRLKWYKQNSWFEKKKYDEDADEFPLKRILLCPECNRHMTKRKSKSKTWDLHPYYGCNTPWCKLFKKALRRDEVHEAVRKRLEEITPSKDIISLFDKAFKLEWDNEKWDTQSLINQKKQEIRKIEAQLDTIDSILSKTENEAYFRKKEMERAELNQRKEDLEYEINDTNFGTTQFQKAYNDAKTILFAPAYIREYWDVEMKQLIIRVCFNWVIYYSKNEGCQTPQISNLYLAFKDISDTKNLLPGGAEYRTPV